MLDNRFTVLFVARQQGDLANLMVLRDSLDVDSTEVATKFADRGGDSAEAARRIADPEKQGEAVTCTGS